MRKTYSILGGRGDSLGWSDRPMYVDTFWAMSGSIIWLSLNRLIKSRDVQRLPLKSHFHVRLSLPIISVANQRNNTYRLLVLQNLTSVLTSRIFSTASNVNTLTSYYACFNAHHRGIVKSSILGAAWLREKMTITI